MKPDKQARALLINSHYFCNDKVFSFELALYMCELVLQQNLNEDDRAHWKQTKEEIYNTRK